MITELEESHMRTSMTLTLTFQQSRLKKAAWMETLLMFMEFHPTVRVDLLKQASRKDQWLA